jgi:hypothetical protein
MAVRFAGERCVLVTRGDSLPYPDSLVHSSQVLGRVDRVVRAGKETQPARRPGRFSSAASWCLCRSASLRRVAVVWHSLRCRSAAGKPTGDPDPAASVVIESAE